MLKIKANKKNILISILIFAALICSIILIVFFVNKKSVLTKEKSIINDIESYKGYTRHVGKEEYKFYYSLIKRDLNDDLSDEAIDEKVKDEINKINATFYLGNKFGINEPYSFENLKKQMDDENSVRQVKKTNGETIYGLEEFSLESFYKYTISNLELDIASYISENTDKKILQDARAYFDKDPATFKILESVKYEINGEKEISLDRNDLKGIKNSDGQLFDFLSDGEEAEEFSYETSGEHRDVKILEKSYEETSFEESKSQIVREYISKNLYNSLIETVAENNLVEFDFNI